MSEAPEIPLWLANVKVFITFNHNSSKQTQQAKVLATKNTLNPKGKQKRYPIITKYALQNTLVTSAIPLFKTTCLQ